VGTARGVRAQVGRGFASSPPWGEAGMTGPPLGPPPHWVGEGAGMTSLAAVGCGKVKMLPQAAAAGACAPLRGAPGWGRAWPPLHCRSPSNGVLSHVGRRDTYLVWCWAGDGEDAPPGRCGGLQFCRGLPLGPRGGAGLTGMMMMKLHCMRVRVAGWADEDGG